MTTPANAVPAIIRADAAGNLYYSLDNGLTFNPAVAGGGGTIHTSAPLSGDGSVGTPATIAAGAIALSKLATEADQTVLGNVSGGTASPVALTATQVKTFLANPTSFFETGTLDLTGTGLTTLVPALAGKKWRTDQLRFRVLTNSGLSVAAQINLGVTAASYNDIVSAFSIGGAFPGDNSYVVNSQTTFATVDVGTTPIILNRAQAATGTALTCSFQIWGEYI